MKRLFGMKGLAETTLQVSTRHDATNRDGINSLLLAPRPQLKPLFRFGRSVKPLLSQSAVQFHELGFAIVASQ